MSATCATAVSRDVLPTVSDEIAGLDPQRWRALPVILIGSFLAFLDFFIVNIALPAMQTDLGANPAQLQFVVAAYGIGFGVSLITGGRLGDIFGRKRVFLLGIAGFTLASTLCGLAATPGMLIASRVVQAICAATVTPQVFPSSEWSSPPSSARSPSAFMARRWALPRSRPSFLAGFWSARTCSVGRGG